MLACPAESAIYGHAPLRSPREASGFPPYDHSFVIETNEGSHVRTGRRFRAAVPLVAAALTVLATLPYDWQSHSHWARVAWFPLFTGLVRPLDLVVNVLLYLPLGAAMQWRTDNDVRWRAVAACMLLSTTMEFSQVWSHDRFPSATDVLMNIAGGLLGAAGVRRWRRRRGSAPQAGFR